MTSSIIIALCIVAGSLAGVVGYGVYHTLRTPGFWRRLQRHTAKTIYTAAIAASVASLASVLATAFFYELARRADVQLPQEAPKAPLVIVTQDGAPDGTEAAQGWTPDLVAVMEDAQRSGWRTFADTPAGQAGDLPREVYLWQILAKLLGAPTPLKDQNPTGSCVGFGTTTAIERTEASEIASRGGNRTEFAFFSEEVTYAGGKVQGARLLGASVNRDDGSAGVFTKAFLAQYGMCPKGKYASCDLTQYDAARARSWNTTGPPAEVLAACKRYPVRDSVRVTGWAQGKQAVASGYGVSICATWKFSTKRDANGVAAEIRTGRLWNHCMCLDGYIVLPDGREFGHIENSWSDIPDADGVRHGPYHTGPVGWGSPTTAGFWAPADAIDRALRQGDSYAYSGITGFPARRIPHHWFIDARPRPDPLDLRGVPCLAI